MVAPARLVFVLHFHQPFGNLDSVMADATARCYVPTLDLLAAHPHVKTGIHVSGPLLQWLATHEPRVVDKLRLLVERHQVEVLGGGLEEPMLAILPDRDAVGQLVAMAELCERTLGQRPRGMWLAERVWEPDLPRTIAAAGYRYTLLDDSHLFAAGVTGRPHGYYVTEKAGDTVAVLPIDRGLRTRIPFADLPDLFEYLRGAQGVALTYGDDVEKFGLWPTTGKRVWKDKWLDRFFTGLAEHASWLETTLPSTLLGATRPTGLVYLPTISYAEMGTWALPADASAQLIDVTKKIEKAGLADEAAPFLRGGLWQAFLAKYPESRRIYRKMLRVSKLVEDARLRGDPAYEAARAALYRGQCNCAYWHGLFGGLYLQHLRNALMRALIEAEALVSHRHGAVATVVDHDGDLSDEVLLEGTDWNAYVAPSRGGSVFELDLIGPRFHLTDVLGRRLEAYHRDVARARVVPDEELENVSAHDLVRATEPNLVDKLAIDGYERGAFVDHLLPADATPDGLSRGTARPLVELAQLPYAIERAYDGGATAGVVMTATVEGVAIRKEIAIDGATVTARLALEPPAGVAARDVALATEFDFTLLAPDASDGRALVVRGPGVRDEVAAAPGARAAHTGVTQVDIISESLGVHVRLEADPPAELWRLPIETVSQSERGFEPTYQGTALVFVWRAPLGGGHALRTSLRATRVG